ncbi:MAG: hypothetical protein VW985_06245 [Gammaproteobacteria bacterium]
MCKKIFTPLANSLWINLLCVIALAAAPAGAALAAAQNCAPGHPHADEMPHHAAATDQGAPAPHCADCPDPQCQHHDCIGPSGNLAALILPTPPTAQRWIGYPIGIPTTPIAAAPSGPPFRPPRS